MRKTVSLSSIFLILLTTLGYAGAESLKLSIDQRYAEAQLSEDNDNESLEFRRTIKISLSGRANIRSYDSIYDISRLGFKVIHTAMYGGYLQKCVLIQTPDRLFIHLCALII